MNGLRAGCVEHCRDVMPSIRSETLQSNSGRFPFLRCEVEDAPSVAGVVCLPCEVVRISIGRLLALEFDSLWRVRILPRHKEIEIVAQIGDRIGNRGLFDEVIATGIRWSAVYIKISCRPAETGIRNALAHVIIGSLACTADVAAAATRLPSRLTLETGVDNCASGVCSGWCWGSCWGGRSRWRRGSRVRRRGARA